VSAPRPCPFSFTRRGVYREFFCTFSWSPSYRTCRLFRRGGLVSPSSLGSPSCFLSNYTGVPVLNLVLGALLGGTTVSCCRVVAFFSRSSARADPILPIPCTTAGRPRSRSFFFLFFLPQLSRPMSSVFSVQWSVPSRGLAFFPFCFSGPTTPDTFPN